MRLLPNLLLLVLLLVLLVLLVLPSLLLLPSLMLLLLLLLFRQRGANRLHRRRACLCHACQLKNLSALLRKLMHSPLRLLQCAYAEAKHLLSRWLP